MHQRTLQIVLKVSERCNLNCSYCYYYNMEDETPGARPALLSTRIVEGLIKFLHECAKTAYFDQAVIILHGGEPMLMPVARMRMMLNKLNNNAPLGLPIFFGMQTNGTILTDGWLDIIRDFQISVCVSIDGNEATHNIYRRDKKNQPTHHIVQSNIVTLQSFLKNNSLPHVTLMSVAGGSAEGKETYIYFTDNLDVKYIDFLLPDATHDVIDHEVSKSAEVFLETAYNSWLYDVDRPQIPYFQGYVNTFLGLITPGPTKNYDNDFRIPNIYTIYSDGHIAGNDYVRSVLSDSADSLPKLGDKLLDVMERVSLLEGLDFRYKIPDSCGDCKWRQACRGGQMIHRHSLSSGFANKSVYCGHIQRMYELTESAYELHIQEKS